MRSMVDKSANFQPTERGAGENTDGGHHHPLQSCCGASSTGSRAAPTITSSSLMENAGGAHDKPRASHSRAAQEVRR